MPKELHRFLIYSDTSIPLVNAHRGEPVKGFSENGANILSSDRYIEAGVQLMKFADDKKLKSKHIKLEKGNKLKRSFKIESPFFYIIRKLSR